MKRPIRSIRTHLSSIWRGKLCSCRKYSPFQVSVGCRCYFGAMSAVGKTPWKASVKFSEIQDDGRGIPTSPMQSFHTCSRIKKVNPLLIATEGISVVSYSKQNRAPYNVSKDQKNQSVYHFPGLGLSFCLQRMINMKTRPQESYLQELCLRVT